MNKFQILTFMSFKKQFLDYLRQSFLKWILVAGLIFFLYTYMTRFSPYMEDGSLDPLVILIVFSVITFLFFLIIQAISRFFLTSVSANKLAILGSLIIAQLLLINTGNFLSFNSIIIILLLNFCIFAYVIKFYANKW